MVYETYKLQAKSCLTLGAKRMQSIFDSPKNAKNFNRMLTSE